MNDLDDQEFEGSPWEAFFRGCLAGCETLLRLTVPRQTKERDPGALAGVPPRTEKGPVFLQQSPDAMSTR